jgi:tetratricopeptide (TPR) repeat protein
LQKAAQLSTDLCFPYGDESVKVLRNAISKNTGDASACYLLGNALADYQYEEAVKYWQRAAKTNDKESIIYRNIAYLQANHLQNLPDAMANIMKAISLNPSEPRFFSEAILYMSYASLTPQKLSEFLTKYGGVMVKNSTDIQLLEVSLNNYYGRYDKSISRLKKIDYHGSEGSTFNPHVYWFDAHLQKGILQMKNKKYAEAEKNFLKGMEFPANFEDKHNGKIGIAYYYLGLNSKFSNNPKKAKDYFAKMMEYSHDQGWSAGDFPELNYFKTLAMLELGGDKAEAEKLFKKMIEDGEKLLVTVKDMESHSGTLFLIENKLSQRRLHVSSFYIQGLGYLGLGDKGKARLLFTKAMDIDPLNMDAKLMLESIK